MSSKGDGGPAFPNQFQGGMTLRDWFAGQALVAIIEANLPKPKVGNKEKEWFNPEFTAGGAYGMAQAMVNEKNQIEAAERADEINRAKEYLLANPSAPKALVREPSEHHIPDGHGGMVWVPAEVPEYVLQALEALLREYTDNGTKLRHTPEARMAAAAIAKAREQQEVDKGSDHDEPTYTKGPWERMPRGLNNRLEIRTREGWLIAEVAESAEEHANWRLIGARRKCWRS